WSSIFERIQKEKSESSSAFSASGSKCLLFGDECDLEAKVQQEFPSAGSTPLLGYGSWLGTGRDSDLFSPLRRKLPQTKFLQSKEFWTLDFEMGKYLDNIFAYGRG